jgi:uncharacterized protein (UPF0303 family)
MAVSDDIATIARQEQALLFDGFDEDRAWRLGGLLRERAVAEGWPVVIDIRSFARPLFLAALPGSSPDNVDWARRKGNVVTRYHRSSYAVGLELQVKGGTLESRYGLSAADHAAHGGAVPVAVRGTGVIGVTTISGLPQREDHGAVVWAMGRLLGVEVEDLPPQ